MIEGHIAAQWPPIQLGIGTLIGMGRVPIPWTGRIAQPKSRGLNTGELIYHRYRIDDPTLNGDAMIRMLSWLSGVGGRR